MAASVRGHKDVVDALLRHGANVDQQNLDGHTALMFAYNGRNQVKKKTWGMQSRIVLTHEPTAYCRRSFVSSPMTHQIAAFIAVTASEVLLRMCIVSCGAYTGHCPKYSFCELVFSSRQNSTPTCQELLLFPRELKMASRGLKAVSAWVYRCLRHV